MDLLDPCREILFAAGSGKIDEYAAAVVVVSKVQDGRAEGCLMGGVLHEEHVNDGSVSV